MSSIANQSLRYTGPRPFTERERDRFFGRDEDIEALGRTLRLNRLTVLTGKSGMGKSSLLQAGVVPTLQARGFRSVPIRFEAWDGAQKISPSNRIQETLAALPESRHDLLERINAGNAPSFWQQCKALTANGQPLLLVFDQFEELFTYPDDAVAAFGEAFAYALLGEMPESFRTPYNALQNSLSEAETAFITAEIPLHVVLSIRADRMDRLTRLSDFLPNILRNSYELKPLTEMGARAAIIKTARAEGDFASAPFRYTPEALTHILRELTRPDERGRAREIQSFLLQIICQYAEERVIISKKATTVEVFDLGDISEIIGAFYEYQISKISTDANQQAHAREFVEDGLIFDGVRMTLNEEYALGKFGLKAATLAALENTHLVRAELADGDRRNYELSHDALVAPIMRIRENRFAAQERERLAKEAEDARRQAEAEAKRVQELEILKNQAEAASQKATFRSRIAGGIAVVAILAAAWAWQAQQKATAATAAAETAKRAAEASTQQALANECKANKALLGFWEARLAKAKTDIITYQGANANYEVIQTQKSIDSLETAIREVNLSECR